MAITNLSKSLIDELMAKFEEKKGRRQLDFTYSRLPANNCQQCADCCFASPEVHIGEFLNIYSFIQNMDDDVQAKIAERIVRYEFMSMATLDNKCPFLEEKQCLIYEVRPLQCRFFGLYPRQEYKELQEKSLKQNTEVAQYFARNHRILLPEEVMTYDVDQCENNIDEKGKEIVLGRYERDLTYNQIIALHRQVLSDDILEEDEDELNRFSYLFSIQHFGSEELEELKLEILREYVDRNKTNKLDLIIKDKKFNFGMAKVHAINQTR